jgi:hypothetical protein
MYPYSWYCAGAAFFLYVQIVGSGIHLSMAYTGVVTLDHRWQAYLFLFMSILHAYIILTIYHLLRQSLLETRHTWPKRTT